MRRGFALLEIAVTLGILSILAVLALPNYMCRRDQGKLAEARLALSAIHRAEKAHYAMHAGYTGTLTDLLEVGVDYEQAGLDWSSSQMRSRYWDFTVSRTQGGKGFVAEAFYLAAPDCTRENPGRKAGQMSDCTSGCIFTYLTIDDLGVIAYGQAAP